LPEPPDERRNGHDRNNGAEVDGKHLSLCAESSTESARRLGQVAPALRHRQDIQHLLRFLIETLPWFVPGVVLSTTISAVASGAVGNVVGVRRLIASGLLMGVGVILAATLTPTYSAFIHGTSRVGTCDLSRIGPPPVEDLFRLDETTLNIVLFVPLGIAVGLVQPSGLRRSLIIASIALPLGIETIQLLAPVLARGCQSGDVVDNLTGFAVGAIAGMGSGALVSRAAHTNS
jgi:VanZ like family